jgi:glycosyltransferase involved in cell wall biosynthesis
MNVLHVSSHYGGGVKSIISAWIKHDRENSHTLTYLNPDPENDKPGRFFFTPDIVPDYDIVICHVWNHPALWDFISNTPLPPCRLIGWSHMAGLKPPYILFEKLINYFDEFIYTSPVSNRCGIEKPYIWSCCDIDEFLSIEKRDHTGFNIGYIGTVDFCKMHPDFIQICSMIPEGHFTVIGGGSDLQTVKDQAEALGISHRFTFTGQIQDIKPYLSEMDVFLYPLSPNHYGTCEQILGEVMAAGIPCVTLNNPAENFIILNEGTGFICKDYNEIVSKIKLLQSEKNILDSKKIKNHAKKIYF